MTRFKESYCYEPKAEHSKRSAKPSADTPAASADTAQANADQCSDSIASLGDASAVEGSSSAINASRANSGSSKSAPKQTKTNAVPEFGTSRSTRKRKEEIEIGAIQLSSDDFHSVPLWIWGRYLLINHTVKYFKVDGRPIHTLEMAVVIAYHQKRKKVNDDIKHWAKADNNQAETDQDDGLWGCGCR